MKDINLFNIKLADIELFLNVARYGSFTKAGEKMFMTQSGVSKRISQIENELGLTLFIRNKRELVLTPAGRVLEQRLKNTTYDILKALEAANVAQTGVSGSLRIGFLEWGTIAFVEQLKEFIRRNPQYSIEIYRQRFSELRTSVAQSEMDIIFTTEYDCDQFSGEEFNLLNVEKVSTMAYMHMEHPLAARSKITMEDLRSEPMLMVDQKSSSGYGAYVRSLFQKHGINPLIAQYARDGGEHMGSIMIGKGILIASKYFLENSLENQIARVPIEGEDVYITAVWRKKNTNPVMLRFLDMIVRDMDI